MQMIPYCQHLQKKYDNDIRAEKIYTYTKIIIIEINQNIHNKIL